MPVRHGRRTDREDVDAEGAHALGPAERAPGRPSDDRDDVTEAEERGAAAVGVDRPRSRREAAHRASRDEPGAQPRGPSRARARRARAARSRAGARATAAAAQTGARPVEKTNERARFQSQSRRTVRPADERSLAAEGLPERAHEDVRARRQPRRTARGRRARERRARAPRRRRGLRRVLSQMPPERGEVGTVGVHAEVALDDDPGARLGALVERARDGVDVAVRDDDDARAREPGAVDEGGVVEGVADDEVARPGQRGRAPRRSPRSRSRRRGHPRRPSHVANARSRRRCSSRSPAISREAPGARGAAGAGREREAEVVVRAERERAAPSGLGGRRRSPWARAARAAGRGVRGDPCACVSRETSALTRPTQSFSRGRAFP